MSDPVHSDPILTAEIKKLHDVGFVLVPLTNDGKTPNTFNILTEEERQESIEESVDGKEHPVNYIYNHPEFWNEQRIEKEKTRFKNVSTILGKMHLRDSEGQLLYLDALDIDSQEVFTILCSLSGPDGTKFENMIKHFCDRDVIFLQMYYY